jgi:hypothetical protein
MRSGRSDVSWFLRAVRVVPVIAGAALLGGMIGGFAIYAIDSALTWEPVSQSRPEARADNAASAVNPQTTKPVRIVGGAIPDPSAGMSAPPPAPQQQHNAATPAQSQISSQLLTPKPLGPASQLQPQTASTAPAQTPTATTRWPDALSRAHRNAANVANAPIAQQQAAPPVPAQTSERAANKTSETDRKEANGDRAASADNQSSPDISRHSRHSRRHTIAGTNGYRTGGDEDAATATSPPHRQAARSYDRLYDSYGNRRDQSYSRGQAYGEASDDQEYSGRGNRSYRNTREQFYGDRDDRDDAASQSRSDTRRYGRDTRYRGRSRNREQPEETNRNQAFESARPRPEPFWGGGFFRRGDQDDD